MITKPNLITANPSHSLTPFLKFESRIPIYFPKPSISHSKFISLTSKKHSFLVPFCCLNPTKPHNSSELLTRVSENSVPEEGELKTDYNVQVAAANVPSFLPPAKLSLSDQAFFLLAFIACTFVCLQTSVAFTSLVVAAIPALYAMGRAATSLSKLADTAREELPSTMAAIRLSGMEISDLTLELSDLSQEIADGVNKSAQAVQAAEAGIRQIGTLAHQQTISIIQERASLPIISLQPVVAGAAKKTSHAVGQATKTLMNMISRGELSSENEDDSEIDRVEI
ncbi:uncharacterized protein LOC102628436 isoform X1 [Citrus sinensis]|uniref:uncharacterized protein LOC102628436 isoform X1 n=1 Tax=Citrus sinensis TaxID=2711 RepID=UPI002278B099|nr:uncharacterized protein LOC102628436 isoform X1 [Citrus sinensis]